MRILFVEGDKDVRDYFSIKLKSEFNGIIDVATSGKSAIKILKNEMPYDVIVSDYTTKKESGINLLNYKVRNKIPSAFIFFTGTVKPNIPFPASEYVIIDIIDFRLLCSEIRKSI